MPEELTGVDKAAVLLLSLGPEVATEVFRHLDEGEVRQVTKALARIRSVPADQLRTVEQDYRKRVGGAAGLRVDGLLFARELVSHTVVDDKMGGISRDDILAGVEPMLTVAG